MAVEVEMATANEEQDGGRGPRRRRWRSARADPCVDVGSTREASEVEGCRGDARMPGRGRPDAVAAVAS
jgi:hypothetical protein